MKPNKKNIALALFSLMLSSISFANPSGVVGQGQGVGNGGSDLEVILKAVGHRIGLYLETADGQAAFPQVPGQAFMVAVDDSKVYVGSDPVFSTGADGKATERTCVFSQTAMTIECNDAKMRALAIDSSALYSLIFHEYLGLMSLEDGTSDQPSEYPISQGLQKVIYDVLNTSLYAGPKPIQETSLLTYSVYFLEYLGVNLNTTDITPVECYQKQLPGITQLISDISPEYGVLADDAMKMLSVNARDVQNYFPGFNDGETVIPAKTTDYCATDLVSSSDNLRFMKRYYEVAMPGKGKTAVCDQFVDNLRILKGYIKGSYQQIKRGKIFHRTWVCGITTMSLEMK